MRVEWAEHGEALAEDAASAVLGAVPESFQKLKRTRAVPEA